LTPKEIGLRQLRYHWEIYLLIIPTLLLIGAFSYFPAGSGVLHSLYRWNGADIAEWVGVQNYWDLLQSAEFWDSFEVAFLLGFWNVVKMIPALAVAVAIHRCRSDRLRYLYRLLFVVPMVIPGLVFVLIWRSFFFEATTGYLNRFLMSTHLFEALCWLDRTLAWGGVFTPGQLPSWLGDPRLILTSCVVWGFPWVGSFAVLTHLAKLENISKSIYEAAEIDGVSWWQKFTKIELPLMAGSIYILLVFVIIDTVRDAGTILALAGIEGGPGGRVTVPALFMLREAFINQMMGKACAVGIVLTAVVMLLHKGSTTFMEWKNLSPWSRSTTRVVIALIALVPLAFGRLAILAVPAVLLALPWPRLWRLFRLPPPAELLAKVRKWMGGLAQIAPRSGAERRLVEATARGRSPRELFLRGIKHGYIWFVLSMAFLPLYLMAIVTVKDNQQFYEFPAQVTRPYHWENLASSWQAVAPTLANSVFICTSATAITLGASVCAAYFFARLRAPLTTFLWNAVLVLMMLPSIANLVPLFRLLADFNLLNTLTALILVSSAGGQVVAIFVLRNFVADIPQEMFDAAELDGASHFQQIRTIVIPQAGPILGTVGVMHFVNEWNNFVLPLIVMRDHDRLPVMVQLLRMSGEYIKLWGPLMAGYGLASLPVVILFFFSMRLFIRGLAEGAVQ
jgi:ABC-type glycerol-3-phosphate transport system permease component